MWRCRISERRGSPFTASGFTPERRKKHRLHLTTGVRTRRRRSIPYRAPSHGAWCAQCSCAVRSRRAAKSSDIAKTHMEWAFPERFCEITARFARDKNSASSTARVGRKPRRCVVSA
jgi:hypothetical protein